MEETNYHPYVTPGANGELDYFSGLPNELLSAILTQFSPKQLIHLRSLSMRIQSMIEDTIQRQLVRYRGLDTQKELKADWIQENARLSARAQEALALAPKVNDGSAQSLSRTAAAVAHFVRPSPTVDVMELAIQQGPDALEMMLIMGADPNGFGMDQSPLNTAVEKGDLQAVRHLLKYGANPDRPGKEPALHVAIANGHVEIGRLLIEHGASPILGSSPELYFFTPLRTAVVERNLPFVKLLVGHQTLAHDVELDKGRSALRIAIVERQDDIALFLIDHYPSEKGLDGALFLAIQYDRTELIEPLLKAGANPNAKDASGSTAIQVAVRKGSLPTTRTLIDHGAHPDVRSPAGHSLYQIAQGGGHHHLLPLFLPNKKEGS